MLNFIRRIFVKNYRIVRVGHNMSYAVPRDAWPELLGKKDTRT